MDKNETRNPEEQSKFEHYGFEVMLSEQYSYRDFVNLHRWLSSAHFAKGSIEGIWFNKIEMELWDVVAALIRRAMEEV